MSSRTESPVPEGPFARFRRDHVRVLASVNALEQCALGASGLGDEAALLGFLEYLGHQFATHMAAEDRVLYPALHAAFPAGRAVLEPLRADHVELRLMLSTLSALMRLAASPERTEQVQVVLRDFVDLLRLHVRREESAVFDVASRVLSPEEASELSLRLAPLVVPDLPGSDPEGPTKGNQP